MHIHSTNHTGRRLLLVAFLNIFIVIAEYVGGVLSGSLALISDAGHNLSDVFSLLIAYFGETLSHRRANKQHSFGYKRFEVFTSIVNAFLLCAIAIVIMAEGIERVINPRAIDPAIIIPVAFVGLIVNSLSVFILHQQRRRNLNLRAAYLNLYYDTISSVFIIITGFVIYVTNFVLLDIAISIVISLMLLRSGFTIIKKALHILMEGVPEGIDFERVHHDIAAIPGIHSVHSLHIWSVNSNESYLSCHAHIDQQYRSRINELTRAVHDLLRHKYNITHSAIQLEEIKSTKRRQVPIRHIS
jgi:cobalt-zinc-cadmium efflux system protein